MKNRIAIAMTAVLGLMMVSTVFGQQISDPTLVDTVTEYQFDYEKQDWRKNCVTDYEYEGEYPISKTTSYEYDDLTEKVTFEYTLEDGIPTEMKKTKEGDDTETTVTYMEDGRIDRIREHNQDGTYDYEKIFIYGNGGSYFTMVFHERVSSNQDRDT